MMIDYISLKELKIELVYLYVRRSKVRMTPFLAGRLSFQVSFELPGSV